MRKSGRGHWLKCIFFSKWSLPLESTYGPILYNVKSLDMFVYEYFQNGPCHRLANNIPEPLAIICGCTAQFVSVLVGNPEGRFSNDMAHIK